ncbi:MAG: ATP-binding cassette domain-containing protein [Coriobacteriia bacterium]|nr:ATP-binding cassette domain-containing protein [Coriobacteriia bacterium]
MALLSAKKLSVSYEHDSSTKNIFSSLDLSLQEGEIVDLQGPSGAGKSTLLKALALLHAIDSGDICLESKSYKNFTPQTWRKHVSMSLQKASLIEGTVEENLRYPFSLAVRKCEDAPSQEEMRKLLDSLALEDVELEREASQLSGGQSSRVALARNILTHPKVYLLDEVDAALDSDSAHALWNVIEQEVQKGSAVLRIRHHEDDGRASRKLMLQDKILKEV